MKAMLWLSTALAVLLFAATSATAQTSGSAADLQYEEEPDEGLVERTFTGFITNVTPTEIRVQQDPEATVDDPGYCEQTFDFILPGNPVSGLDIGNQVRVVYLFDPDGFYIQECPATFQAESITVLGNGGGDEDGGDEDGGRNDGGGNDDGGYGDGGVGGDDGGYGGGGGSGTVASDEYAVLPDTGGLPVVGIALTLAAGALLGGGIHRARSSR